MKTELSQEELNKLYSQYEIEASELLGRYFNIRSSKWTDIIQKERWLELQDDMRILAKHGASSLPF